MNEVLRILDQEDARINDVFLSLMMVYGQRTLLPEIMEVFGKEATRKFLDLFAGYEFKVPSRSDIDMAARNAHIYAALQYKLSPVSSLARQYGITPERVAEVHDLTKSILERNGYAKAEETATGGDDGRRRKPA